MCQWYFVETRQSEVAAVTINHQEIQFFAMKVMCKRAILLLTLKVWNDALFSAATWCFSDRGLQYIQTCFQMGGAYSHQGLPGAGDLLPSCRHGHHQRTSYSCKGTHSGDCCCSYSLSRHRKACGGHSVEEILRALRNVACCFDPHQGIWQSLNWITCFTTTCSLMPWWRVSWAPILWTPSFSTLWNSLMVSMISMARKEISCSWHAWVTPCISYLKAGFNIVIIYLRSITPLHFKNFNNFWETIII